MKGTRWIRVAVVAAVLLGSMPAYAWRFDLGENTNLNVAALIQFQAQFQQNAAPDKTDYSKDFFLRRVRFLLWGDVWKGISFFLDSEQPNFGKGGTWDVSMFISDAFVTFKVVDQFMVDAGMMLLPFSRHGFQSAPGLNGLDFHLGLLKYVDGSNKNLRDAGIQLRGYVFDRKLQYRVGVFNGAQGQSLQKDSVGAAVKDVAGKTALMSNPEDWPRFAGHLRYNILGTETEFFAKGITFGQSPTLSIGVGFDYQVAAVMKTATVLNKDLSVKTPGTLTHSLGLTGDVFVDVPFGADKQHEIVFMAGLFYYDHGFELAYDKAKNATLVHAKNSGVGFLSELGYRYTFIEPVLTVDYFSSRQAAQDLLVVKGGLNFWIRNAAVNVKTEFGAQKTGNLASAPWIKCFTTQAQLFF